MWTAVSEKESNTQDVTLEHVDAHPLFLRVFVCVKLLHLTGSSGGSGTLLPLSGARQRLRESQSLSEPRIHQVGQSIGLNDVLKVGALGPCPFFCVSVFRSHSFFPPCRTASRASTWPSDNLHIQSSPLQSDTAPLSVEEPLLLQVLLWQGG